MYSLLAIPPSSRHNKSMPAAVTRDPEVMHGAPCFRGTRVPFRTLFDYLAAGRTLAGFLDDFPTVSRALALRALAQAGLELRESTESFYSRS
jgi:uncharacterized protein (DUF433 family)